MAVPVSGQAVETNQVAPVGSLMVAIGPVAKEDSVVEIVKLIVSPWAKVAAVAIVVTGAATIVKTVVADAPYWSATVTV